MIRQWLKLAFVVMLLTAMLPFKGSVVRAIDQLCSCNTPNYVYLYWDDGTPGGFQYITEAHPDFSGSSYPPGINGGFFCPLDCRNYSLSKAKQLCNANSHPNQHYQYTYTWHWDDPDGDSGGSQNGSVDTGSAMLWCSDLP